MTEAELAQHFVYYFSDYEIFNEVPVGSGSIDFVVKTGPITVAVEVKKTFNMKVIYQAYRNREYCHYSYVAIPKQKDYNAEAEWMCRHCGIGVLVYSEQGFYAGHSNIRPKVKEIVKPEFRRRVIGVRLSEFMKRSVPGSVSDRLTDFKVTCEELKALVKLNGGKMKPDDVFNSRKFHYYSSTSAKNCLVRYAQQGVITGLSFEKGHFIIVK